MDIILCLKIQSGRRTQQRVITDDDHCLCESKQPFYPSEPKLSNENIQCLSCHGLLSLNAYVDLYEPRYLVT